MNSKFFVPFETAKLLKEKGYPQDWATKYYDTFSGGEISLIANKECVSCVVEGNYRHPLLKRLSNLYIAAPTYHEVVDWLYGKKICITCHPAYCYYGQYNGFQYEIQTYDEDDYPDDVYCTREEALNAAILKALEMI